MSNEYIAGLEAILAQFENEKYSVTTIQRVDMLNELARAQTDAGFPIDGIERVAKSALRFAVELRYQEGESRALTRLAWLDYLTGRYDGCYAQSSAAELLARSCNAPRLEAYALYVKAYAQSQLGRWNDMPHLIERVAELAKQLNDPMLEADQRMSHATHLLLEKRYSRALTECECAGEMYARMNDPRIVYAQLSMAEAQMELRRFVEARATLDAIKPHETYQDHQISVFLLRMQARLALLEGNTGGAHEMLSHWLAQVDANDCGSKCLTPILHITIDILHDLAMTQKSLGLLAGAIESLERALAKAEMAQALPQQAETHERFMQLYQAMGAFGLAQDHKRRARLIRQKLGVVREQQESTARQVSYMAALAYQALQSGQDMRPMLSQIMRMADVRYEIAPQVRSAGTSQ